VSAPAWHAMPQATRSKGFRRPKVRHSGYLWLACHAPTLSCFAFFPMDFWEKARLLTVYIMFWYLFGTSDILDFLRAYLSNFQQYYVVNYWWQNWSRFKNLCWQDRKLHVRIYLYPKISVLEITSIILDNIGTGKKYKKWL